MIREAHEAQADLMAARRELETTLAAAKAYVEVMMPTTLRAAIHEAITLAVATEMERLKEDVGKTIDKAKDAIEKSFAKLARYYMYGTESPDEMTLSLTDMTAAMRARHGLQAGQIMPPAFGPRKQAGSKSKR